ncbi:MAG: hypothetical protein ACJAZ8_001708 [Planctomycetota bacterium]|jgi:hypothetical protein
MRLQLASDYATWAAQGLVVALLLVYPVAQASQDQSQALDAIQEYRSTQDYGAAMNAAAGLQPAGLRARYEAEILYSARSYDGALTKALVAIESGDRDELLLLTSVRAAIWVLDSNSAIFCQQLLQGRVVEMQASGLENHEWYASESLKTEQMVGDLLAGDQATEGAIRKSKSLSLAALGAALLGLYLARSKSR